MPASAAPRVPTLTDGLVTLRAHRLEDVDAIVEQCVDPDTLRWTTVPRGYTREEATAFVERIAAEWAVPDGNRYWAIEYADSGRPRFGGTIDLRPGVSPTTADVGFGLHPAARGRGVMSRAVRLVVAHAFEGGPWGVPLQRVHWRAIAGNWGSRRVAWATGFTFHGMIPGTHVDSDNPGGPALDSWYGSLTAGDGLSPRVPWFEPALLEGNGIRLREWRPADREAIEPRHDPAHWMPAHAVITREGFDGWLAQQRDRMASAQAVVWCIADASTDEALGSVVLFSRSGTLAGDTAELGYQLNQSARGRGVVREAGRLAIDHARRSADEGGLGLRRLVAETAADNVASNRVLESLGFRVFGREHAVEELADGTYGDGLHWELLPGA